MTWPHYIACFFAGVIFANVVPHFVYGICGDRFPTPFANPPGKGLSSPVVNVLWENLNLVIGYILFRVGRVSGGGDLALAIFFAGIVALSTRMSSHFSKTLISPIIPGKPILVFSSTRWFTCISTIGVTL